MRVPPSAGGRALRVATSCDGIHEASDALLGRLALAHDAWPTRDRGNLSNAPELDRASDYVADDTVAELGADGIEERGVEELVGPGSRKILRTSTLTRTNRGDTLLGTMSITRRVLLVSSAAFFPASLAAGGESPASLPTIGFLGAGTAAAWGNRVARFQQRLQELGWIEGRTIRFEYRWADGDPERLPAIAFEFVRLTVAVIVTAGHTAVIAAKKATSVIPIVFAAAGNPVGSGIIESLARPGGNVTGLSVQQAEVAGKRLELLRTVVPRLRRVAMLVILANPLHVSERSEVTASARLLGIDVTALEIRGPEDIVPALEAVKHRVDALYVPPDPIVISKLIPINTLARIARLPSIHGSREYVEAGGLMSYGPDFLDLFGRAADYVDRILRGAKPADLPIEQPKRFDFVVSLKTAKALGLTIPPSLLLRADQVIE